MKISLFLLKERESTGNGHAIPLLPKAGAIVTVLQLDLLKNTIILLYLKKYTLHTLQADLW